VEGIHRGPSSGSAESVGVSLGTSIDMVENNLKLIRAQEQARVNIFHESKKQKNACH
jgi:hypothetical protein